MPAGVWRPAAVLLVLVGCADGLGIPRPRPLPAPDDRPPLLSPEARSPRLASYRIDATLDAAGRRITATQRLTWTNDGQSAVDLLPLHLYMNAFKNEDSVFMTESGGRHRNVAASRTHWGWIDVTSVTIDGDELVGALRWPGAPDETVAHVPLVRAVAPGEAVTVDMEFTTQLPQVFARTGFHGPFLMVGQWFPKIGVRIGPPGGETWHCEPFHLASEFFADFGTYDVKLTVPSTHVVAATGVLVDSVDNGDGTFTLGYRAEDVHDFAWMADPHMEVLTGTATVGDHAVEVRVYHRPPQREFARRHLAAGIGAVETFSELFVPYPWPVLSIIDPPMGADGAAGMEYPTLVTTAGDGWYSRPGIRWPEYVTIHEVGHNWFQGILASNEVEEAWLDEGVNEWADGEVIARLYGEAGGIVDWMGATIELNRLRRAISAPMGSVPSPIATASYAFADFDAYATATYSKTALALKTLENLVGRDAFLGAMRRYAEAFAFRHPTGRDFFATLAEALDQDLAWFVGPVFHGAGGVDYAVRTATCEPRHEPPRGVFGSGDDRTTVDDARQTGAYRCEVVIVNGGSIAVPVDVELRFADGSAVRETWDHRGGARWKRFELDRSSPLTEVVIDPDRRVVIADDPLDDHLRMSPDTSASWRAGARVGFWTQTIMQGLGL
jgi:hypothetical protein